MVGNRTDGNILRTAAAVLFTRYFANFVQNFADCVDFKHIVNPLHNAGKALKPHTGVDIFALKFGVFAVSEVVKLRENVVPYFHITVAVAAWFAVGRAAAVLFAAVEIYFAARPAGSRAVFPEVIFFAEPYNAFFGHPDNIAPDGVGFVVAFVNRRPQQVCRDFKRFG